MCRNKSPPIANSTPNPNPNPNPYPNPNMYLNVCKHHFGVKRLGLASQARSQNLTLLGSISGDPRFSKLDIYTTNMTCFKVAINHLKAPMSG